MTQDKEPFDSIHEGNRIAREMGDFCNDEVVIHDETLRDGEQTPGVAFSPEEKIELAKRLVAMGVDSLNLGFPAVSEVERETIKAIVQEVGETSTRLSCLARARASDVETIAECGVSTVAVFVGLSDVHLAKKYNLTEEAAFKQVDANIRQVKAMGLDVRCGFEDSSRAPLERMRRAADLALEAGAYSVGFCDTSGILTPTTTALAVTELVKVTGKDRLYVHFHNDLGMATANSLVALVNGARMVQGTLAGLGERAGNTRLEEIVLALRTKYDLAKHIDVKELLSCAARARELASFPESLNAPITGANTFSHESGIHVHGILNDPATYEPFPPSLIGRAHTICYGKHAGTRNLKSLADKHSLVVADDNLATVLTEVKRLGEEGVKVSERMALTLLRLAAELAS